jgi:hypothetical protein
MAQLLIQQGHQGGVGFRWGALFGGDLLAQFADSQLVGITTKLSWKLFSSCQFLAKLDQLGTWDVVLAVCLRQRPGNVGEVVS